jgi:hypothetical protein
MCDLLATIFRPDDRQGPSQKSMNFVPVLSVRILYQNWHLGPFRAFAMYCQQQYACNKIKLPENQGLK